MKKEKTKKPLKATKKKAVKVTRKPKKTTKKAIKKKTVKKSVKAKKSPKQTTILDGETVVDNKPNELVNEQKKSGSESIVSYDVQASNDDAHLESLLKNEEAESIEEQAKAEDPRVEDPQVSDRDFQKEEAPSLPFDEETLTSPIVVNVLVSGSYKLVQMMVNRMLKMDLESLSEDQKKDLSRVVYKNMNRLKLWLEANVPDALMRHAWMVEIVIVYSGIVAVNIKPQEEKPTPEPQPEVKETDENKDQPIMSVN